jgi:tetratricopeptide (TPR) repeat protein
MSIFRRLFGGKKVARDPASGSKSAARAKPDNDSSMIRVYDAYGRELLITREQWRDNILKGTIQKAWDKPDELYTIIASALHDGFRPEVVRAAEHLHKVDPVRSRGACVWGIVLMEEGRLNEAEKVFREFIAAHGEDGVILTNLAKVYSSREEHAEAERILWHALEVDPNQANGMDWFVAVHRERGGEVARVEALRRIATLPASWRAQLWLARGALESGQLQTALEYYHESLSRAGEPAPADLLMQMSGDLGNHGHLAELLRLAEPRFDAVAHGLLVGNNLIKARLDVGQFDEAKRLVETLYAQKRPDWSKTLSFWETEISNKRLAAFPAPTERSLEMALLTIDGPIWLAHDSPACSLFRVPDGALPWVCFLGSSAEKDQAVESVQLQVADAPGRMSRALPLFLAEQTELYTQCRVRTLVPWIAASEGGFVLSAKPWGDQDAGQMAREGVEKPDYLVLTHVVASGKPWRVQMRLIRTIDGTCLGEWQQACSLEDAEHLASQFGSLVSQLHSGIHEHAGILPRPSASAYRVPEGSLFADYLLRLEQLLAVRCAGMEGVNAGFLTGEREIIEGNIGLCATYPESTTTRLLLAQTLLAMKRVCPDIIHEYTEKVALLQREKPLAEPAHGIIRRMLDEAVTA